MIFHVVLYGCEAWFLTSREECRVRVFDTRVVERVLKHRREEVRGKWRILHKEKLYALHSSLNITCAIKSRRMRLAGHVARMGR